MFKYVMQLCYYFYGVKMAVALYPTIDRTKVWNTKALRSNTQQLNYKINPSQRFKAHLEMILLFSYENFPNSFSFLTGLQEIY